MHYFGPEMGGGGGSPNFTEFMVVKAYVVFSACIAHNFDTKTVELSAKRIMQGRWWFIQMKITLSKYLATKLVSNQVPPCPFSMMECLQWKVFPQYKDTLCRTLDQKLGVGICPRVSLNPKLCGMIKTQTVIVIFSK